MKSSTLFMQKHLACLGLIVTGLSVEPTYLRADLVFLGVASGDASQSEAVLWTRALDTNAPSVTALTLQLAANDPTFTTGAVTLSVSTDPAKDYTAKIVVSNLLAGTRYYYRFVNATNPSNSSIVGTFKTAPTPNAAAPVHFAFSGYCDASTRPS